MKNFLECLLIITGVLIIFISTAHGIENIKMEIQKRNNSLFVKSTIVPSQEFIEDFRSGLSKNISILIELFRRWTIIPDEFIKGYMIQRILISDPIKEEFIIKTVYGEGMVEKRFKNWQEALNWALNIDTVKIADVNTLEQGRYYIKITVESNIKKLPLVFEHILFFIPKYEKKITKESEIFRLP